MLTVLLLVYIGYLSNQAGSRRVEEATKTTTACSEPVKVKVKTTLMLRQSQSGVIHGGQQALNIP